MSEIASAAQLRASLLRWALFLVPGIILLGYLSAKVSLAGPENAWFATLDKPSLFPPPMVFTIVWTILYAIMGLALAMVASARGASGRGIAVAAFVVQLALNLAWAPLFFGAHQITAGLTLMVVLDVAVVITIVLFRRVRLVASLLLLPYLAWILFATALNWEFLNANPGADGQEVSSATTRVEF